MSDLLRYYLFFYFSERVNELTFCSRTISGSLSFDFVTVHPSFLPHSTLTKCQILLLPSLPLFSLTRLYFNSR